ncbi:hypothetical protein NL493_29530, partial [Klebsiella pneumoniae]|nr:hypothetical protein [Klebsiella pneumoniae]
QSSAEVSEGRGQRRSQERTSVHERNLQNLNGQRTLLNYSEVRSKTAQYLGYIKSEELFMMTPKEWQDWVKGARERELDMLEFNL